MSTSNEMKILIFGASGATGLNLITQSVDQGHQVKAFVRDPAKLKFRDQRLSVFQGDVSNYQQVEGAVRDQDAVISALGASNPVKRDFTLIRGIENIVAAMVKLRVDRIVYQSFLGVSENREDFNFIVNRILPVLLAGSIKDHEVKEENITSSGLQWTIVRCPTLTNGSLTKDYLEGERIRSDALVPSLSRADVAHFILRELRETKYVGKKPRIMKR